MRCYKAEFVPRKYALGFIQLLAPFAPHLAEEMWKSMVILSLSHMHHGNI